jgi:uncharacterized membrane protein YkoI
MKTFIRYTLLVWLGLSWVLPMTALAAISSQQASEIARQHMPGRVLAVTQAQYQGREVYQIKLLNTHGEVHIILIDANSGKRVGR